MANIFRTASTWLKIAIASMAIGLILFVIGFSTTSWMVSKHAHSKSSNGLWQAYYCQRSGYDCATRTYSDNNDYHRAIQAMECLGLIGFLLSIIVLLGYMSADFCRRRDYLQGATALCFAGILFACIGFAIFGSNSNEENIRGFSREIGWSMGIAIAGTVFYGISGVMLILQLIGR